MMWSEPRSRGASRSSAQRAQPGARMLCRVQGAVHIEQQRARRCFLAVRCVQDGAGRAAAVVQFRKYPFRRPTFPEDLADHCLR